MKPKTWWYIGAILFCAIGNNAIVTLVVLIALLVPVLGKALEWSYIANTPSERKKYQDK